MVSPAWYVRAGSMPPTPAPAKSAIPVKGSLRVPMRSVFGVVAGWATPSPRDGGLEPGVGAQPTSMRQTTRASFEFRVPTDRPSARAQNFGDQVIRSPGGGLGTRTRNSELLLFYRDLRYADIRLGD